MKCPNDTHPHRILYENEESTYAKITGEINLNRQSPYPLELDVCQSPLF